jgi:PAS domain S-box-containing protein
MRRSLVSMLVLNLMLASASVAQPAARQVLLLNSFERGSATENLFGAMLRAELAKSSPGPINFFEVSLQPALEAEKPREEAVVEYLRSAFGQRVDVVVTLGGPAAEFAQKFRERIFPTTPLFMTAMDQRWVENRTFAANETALGVVTNPVQILDDMLRLLPDTTTVFVVIGSSRIEDLWRHEFGKLLRPFEGRLTFVWSNELSFDDMLQRAAVLPPRSAIFYLLLSMDAKGVSQEEERTLTELHAVANAPLFGLYDIQVGRGMVGGSLLSVHDAVQGSAGVILRILQGESAGSIKLAPQSHGQPTFDWRELNRWGINEARLPAGSLVLFRQPGLWEQYKGYVVAAAVLLGVQTMFITALVVQRSRRRRSELALRESEERFRLMANGTPVMVWTAQPDMSINFFNRTVLEFTGQPMEALLGDGWRGRVHPDDGEKRMSNYAQAFAARQPIKMEYRLRRADDTYRWLLDTGVPRCGPDGTFAGYIGSAIDITERREMEQSLLANEAALRRAFEQNRDLAGRLINAQEAERRRIARDLHDDLSQQLAGVAIMLSGLKRLAGKPNAQPEVDRTVTTLQERTSALAQAVRTLSHELHPSVLQHSGLVATLKHHCAEVQQHHHLDVVLTADDNLEALRPDIALCLFRVAQEALTNVVRHACARTIHVQLTGTLDSVELRVSDDGLGFVAGEKIGGGLGLRSIDERVRLTRGDVQVDSQLGHGTTLRVRIPRGPGPAAHVQEC